jgi:phosphoribosylformimino-5-aminoimidazole carboxamide ribotide isomerase
MKGPSLDLYREILRREPDLHLIASGGVRSLDDIYTLEEAGCRGAIVGKAIYEGMITLKELAHVN